MEEKHSTATPPSSTCSENSLSILLRTVKKTEQKKGIVAVAKVKKKLATEGGRSTARGEVRRRLFDEPSITIVQPTKTCLTKVPDVGLRNECLDNNNTEASQVLDLGVNEAKADHSGYVRCAAKRHVCEYCQKSFKSNGKLNSHIYSHTGERPFQCTKCSKAFSSKFKLVRHGLIHAKVRKFVCHICDRTFLRNDHLKNHIKIHDPLKRWFQCEREACGKKYSSVVSLKKHEAAHLVEDGSLICLVCNRKFETKYEIQLHLKSHTGSRLFKSQVDKKFKCQYCDMLFLTKKDVTRHLVVHTRIRDFLCQFCPQRFGRKDHLVRHIKKTHDTEKKKRAESTECVKRKNEKDVVEGVKQEELMSEAGPNIFIIPNNSIILVKNEQNEVNFEEPVLVVNETVRQTGNKVKSVKLTADLPDPGTLASGESALLAEVLESACVDDLDPLHLLDSNLSVDEEIKGEELLLSSPGGGEILRNLLMSNDDILSTPLPGFSQIFNYTSPN